MATVAALIKTAFIIVTRLVGISTIISSGDEAYDGPLLGQVIGMAGTVPEGFLAGFVVWRVPRLRVWRSSRVHGDGLDVPRERLTRRGGRIAASTVGCRVRRAAVGVALAANSGTDLGSDFGYTAFTTTFWLSLLVGALRGDIHEYGRTESTAITIAQRLDVQVVD